MSDTETAQSSASETVPAEPAAIEPAVIEPVVVPVKPKAKGRPRKAPQEPPAAAPPPPPPEVQVNIAPKRGRPRKTPEPAAPPPPPPPPSPPSPPEKKPRAKKEPKAPAPVSEGAEPRVEANHPLHAQGLADISKALHRQLSERQQSRQQLFASMLERSMV